MPECMAAWDKATHITKTRWKGICARTLTESEVALCSVASHRGRGDLLEVLPTPQLRHRELRREEFRAVQPDGKRRVLDALLMLSWPTTGELAARNSAVTRAFYQVHRGPNRGVHIHLVYQRPPHCTLTASLDQSRQVSGLCTNS